MFKIIHLWFFKTLSAWVFVKTALGNEHTGLYCSSWKRGPSSGFPAETTAHRKEHPECWKWAAGGAQGSWSWAQESLQAVASDPSPMEDSLLLSHPPATWSEDPRPTVSRSKCTQLAKTKQRRKLPDLYFVKSKWLSARYTDQGDYS